MTLTEAAKKAGLSRSRVSQLVRGYEQKGRNRRYLPLLKQGEHWEYEERDNRPHTTITPDGIALLKKVASGKIQQQSESVETEGAK